MADEAKARQARKSQQQFTAEETAPGPQGTEQFAGERYYDDVNAQYTRSDDAGFLTESVSKDGEKREIK